jgi:hypothetical protein
MLSCLVLNSSSIFSFLVIQLEYKVFSLVSVPCFSISFSIESWLFPFCCVKAFANSSAEANSVPCNPKLAKHLPKLEVAAFSKAEVLLTKLESLLSSA